MEFTKQHFDQNRFQTEENRWTLRDNAQFIFFLSFLKLEKFHPKTRLKKYLCKKKYKYIK